MPILFLRNQLTLYHVNMVPGLGFYICLLNMGFPGGSAGKESTCNAGDLGFIPGWEDPLEKGTATHSSILAWRIPWTV